MWGRGLPEGRQVVPRAGKWEVGPKPPASSPECRTQPCRRLGPGVCPLRCWRSRAPCWGPGGRLRVRTGSTMHTGPRGGSTGLATLVPGHRVKFCHNLSAERPGLAAACLPNIPMGKDCQLPLRQWTERDCGSGELVLPTARCITDRSRSQGAHCRRQFRHPRPLPHKMPRTRPAGTSQRRRAGLPRSSPANTPLSPVVIASQKPPCSWRHFWSEALCAVLIPDEVPQPDVRGAGSQIATPGERPGEAERHVAMIHAGCGPFPAHLRNGPRSSTSGSRLAAATFAGPLYLSRWTRFWLRSGPVTLLLHAF